MHDYLKEEIQAEALTRNLPAFSRFLQSAAATNGMLLNYSNKDFPISFWRTASGSEVDLILGEADAALEIRSASEVGERAGGLYLFREEVPCRKAFVVSKEPRPRKIGSEITVLPWQVFCEMLWAGEVV